MGMLHRSSATIYENMYTVPGGLKIVSPATTLEVIADLEFRGVRLGDCEIDEST